MWDAIKTYRKLHFIWLLPAIVVLFVGLAATHAKFGSIEDPQFCASCHQKKYDDASFSPITTSQLSTMDLEAQGLNAPPISISSGVQVGCAECHPKPYNEYMHSAHGKSQEANRPGCLNCHDAHSIGTFWGYMFLNAEPWKYGVGPMAGLKDDRIWEGKVRPKLAAKVRNKMLANNSERCRSCHQLPSRKSSFKPDLIPHRLRKSEGMTCIECHYNLVHRAVNWPEIESSGLQKKSHEVKQ